MAAPDKDKGNGGKVIGKITAADIVKVLLDIQKYKNRIKERIVPKPSSSSSSS